MSIAARRPRQGGHRSEERARSGRPRRRPGHGSEERSGPRERTGDTVSSGGWGGPGARGRTRARPRSRASRTPARRRPPRRSGVPRVRLPAALRRRAVGRPVRLPGAAPPPQRPGQVITAAVLAFAQAVVVLIASLYVWFFASIADLAAAGAGGTRPGTVESLAAEGTVLAVVQVGVGPADRRPASGRSTAAAAARAAARGRPGRPGGALGLLAGAAAVGVRRL